MEVNFEPRKRWIVGISGASGAIYGITLCRTLLEKGFHVHLVISDAGWRVLQDEMGVPASKRTSAIGQLFGDWPEQLIYHPVADIGASIASGSYLVEGMVIIPCSMGTLASVASGISGNLLQRAADVMLKEGRRLIIVPRETPLSTVHLENMLRLSKLGVRIIPAMPAFYNAPQSIQDMVRFLVGKVLDSMQIDNQLYNRWGGNDGGSIE